MKMKLLLLIPIVALLSGCMNTPKLIKALSADPATVHLRVTTIYGVIELDRTAPRTNSMPHTIKDGTISVGQP